MNDFWDIVGTEVNKIHKCLKCVLTMCDDENYDALLHPDPCIKCGKWIVRCDCVKQQYFFL